MTEDEAIRILEEELVSASGWLTRALRGETRDSAVPAQIYEALSALSEAWADTIFVPKRAVLPMMQVDSALCEMNDPPFVVPGDLPSLLGDLSVRVEEVLYGNDTYRQHLTQLAFGQNPR